MIVVFYNYHRIDTRLFPDYDIEAQELQLFRNQGTQKASCSTCYQSNFELLHVTMSYDVLGVQSTSRLMTWVKHGIVVVILSWIFLNRTR